MMILGIFLAVVSLTGCVFWIIGMRKLFTDKKPEVKKEKIDEFYTESHRNLTSFSKSFTYNKGVRYSVEHKEGMTYTEIEDGIKKRNPNTITFIQIFLGFYFFIIGIISSIGSFTVASGSTDGWYMIGFCVFFTTIFIYIVISQKLNANKVKVN